jgi:hypothetical protein
MQFVESKETFQRYMQPSYSGSKNKPRKQAGLSSHLLHVGFLLGLFSDPENGGNIFLRDICLLTTEYMSLYLIINCAVRILEYAYSINVILHHFYWMIQ